jgi:hypothetical protein
MNFSFRLLNSRIRFSDSSGESLTLVGSNLAVSFFFFPIEGYP